MLSNEAQEFLSQFPYTAEEIIESLEKLKSLKVLVIGDTIIDQYHYCSSIGKSPKDNVIVVKYLAEESFAGGVLAAANHIAGFCDKVDLVTCLGRQNSQENFIRQHLKKNVIPKFFYRDDTSTIIKRRFVEPTFLMKMFGVSFLDDYTLPDTTDREVCDYLGQIENYDLVVVTDFGHGFISKEIVNGLKWAKFLAVNTQTNTDNAGFNLIDKYPHADYICLDEPETRLACQDKYGKLENLVVNISQRLKCPKVAVTHGSQSTLMYNGGIYKIPIFSGEVKDTVGAGDAFFVISSLCVARGFPMDLVGFIGNAVGALKVKIVCNRSSVEPMDLYEFIKKLLDRREQ